MTGVAGRVTVLTANAELLLAVAAGEAGGMAAALTLLVAPLAAPADTKRRESDESTQPEGNSVVSGSAPAGGGQGGTFTFFGFHVLAVAVREVVLDLALLHGVGVVIVVVVVEPQLLVLVYRPGVSPVPAGGGGRR